MGRRRWVGDMMKFIPLPSTEYINELLHYDADTGFFTWKARPNPKWHLAGKRAGRIDSEGYCVIKINGRNYWASRLAWKIMRGNDPASEIDHKNCNAGDNRIANLREATGSQNCANTRGYGIAGKGVQQTQSGKFHARIMKNGHMFCLGTFDDRRDARYAYAMAARSMFGLYARA